MAEKKYEIPKAFARAWGIDQFQTFEECWGIHRPRPKHRRRHIKQRSFHLELRSNGVYNEAVVVEDDE